MNEKTPNPLNLPALREHAHELLRGENVSEFEPGDALALIDRVEELQAMFIDKLARCEGAKMRADAAEKKLAAVREIADDINRAGYVVGLARNLYRVLDGPDA